jgi:glucose/arabinose dehydrogenase
MGASVQDALLRKTVSVYLLRWRLINPFSSGTNIANFCAAMAGSRIVAIGMLLFALGTGVIVTGQSINLPARQPHYGYFWTNALIGVKFTQPVGVVTAPGQTNSLYVVERQGRVMAVPDLTKPEGKVFLDLRAQTHPYGGEAGLLGLAFHPDYPRNGRFFVFRTAIVGGVFANVLSEFKRDALNPDRADPNSELRIFSEGDVSDGHNAGDLHFGPDGYLYVSVGYDGPPTRREPQEIDNGLFGGILRIDVDRRPENLPANSHQAATGNYRVPVDNPFVGATNFNGKAVDPANVRTEFYAVGLRNPWRFCFDPLTGKLICGDVGGGWWEEVNIIEKGKNYGWPFIEGKSLLHLGGGPSNLKPPYYEYLHGSGSFEGRAIIGGLVYTGSNFPELHGKYIFGDITLGNIWALDMDQSNPQPTWLTAMADITSFGRDPRDGGVLVANIKTGEIYKLNYIAPEDSGIPRYLSEVAAFSSLTSLESSKALEYQVNTPFWSDGALKRRWMSLVNAEGLVQFKATEPWNFPNGAIFIKHFDFEMTNGVPSSRRRLETRFIVKSTNGAYGLTYRWNPSGSDAELVPPQGIIEYLKVNEGGRDRLQKWYFPGWEQCNLCHTEQGGRILGVNTHQLNKPVPAEGGIINQLELMRMRNFFNNPGEVNSEGMPRFSSLNDTNAPLQHRVRSYLASNCVQCHQPGGSSTMFWDARITTPTEQMNIINAPSVHQIFTLIVPGSHVRSFMYDRVYHEIEWFRMPPIASVRPDTQFVNVLTNWIHSIPDAKWTSRNLGPAPLEGSAEQYPGRFKLSSSGRGIAEEGMFYVYKQVAGLSEITGQLNHWTNQTGEAGIMLRESELPGSAYASVYVRGSDLVFRARSRTGVQSHVVSSAPSRLITWLGLSLHGNEVSAAYQNLSGKWVTLGITPVDFRDEPLAGFFVASGKIPVEFATAEFSAYSLRALNISLVEDQGGSALVRASLDDGMPGRLILESSPDLLEWEEETRSDSGGAGEMVELRHLDSEYRFYRVRKMQ